MGNIFYRQPETLDDIKQHAISMVESHIRRKITDYYETHKREDLSCDLIQHHWFWHTKHETYIYFMGDPLPYVQKPWFAGFDTAGYILYSVLGTYTIYFRDSYDMKIDIFQKYVDNKRDIGIVFDFEYLIASIIDIYQQIVIPVEPYYEEIYEDKLTTHNIFD